MNINASVGRAQVGLRRLLRVDHNPQEYFYEVSALIRRFVPHDASGWITLDPDTLLPGGTLVTENRPPELSRTLLRNELVEDDVNSVQELVKRASPICVLSELDPAAMAHSPRIQSILRPAGLGDELRAMLRASGSTWGHVALYRELGSRDFSNDERAFMANVIPDIAVGLRRSLARRPERGTGFLSPGVVALDSLDRIIAVTTEAQEIMALMPWDAVPTLYAVAIGAGHQDRARARIRLTDGRWILLQGGRMHGAVPDAGTHVTVSLVPAPRSVITPVLLRLHALSVREREVAMLLMRGGRTEEIAAQLHISPHTLRDHVKSIFAKFGVRGRTELMAVVADYVSPDAGGGDGLR